MAGRYRCKKCGYNGDELVFELTSYEYCIATNSDEPDYVDNIPTWVQEKGMGCADIGDPVGCPKCHTWGFINFEEVEEEEEIHEGGSSPENDDDRRAIELGRNPNLGTVIARMGGSDI